MSLRDKLAEEVRKSVEKSKAESKDIAEQRMFRDIALKIARTCGVYIYKALKEDDMEEAVRTVGEGTPLQALYVKTGYVDPSTLMTGNILKRDIYKTFLNTYKENNAAILVFKCKGVGTMAMAEARGDVRPGYPRVTVYSSNNEMIIQVMPLELFLEEYQG